MLTNTTVIIEVNMNIRVPILDTHTSSHIGYTYEFPY